MDALVMCGGAGTRLDADAEKPLYEVCGGPMVEAVVAALAGADRIGTVHAAVSPSTTQTAAHLRDLTDPPAVIETPGDGYVADLDAALDRVRLPAVTAAADLPLLVPDHVASAVAAHRDRDGASVAVCVPAALKRRLGLSVGRTIRAAGRELAPTGLNVVGVGEREATTIRYDARLAVNVNRVTDAAVAEALCG